MMMPTITTFPACTSISLFLLPPLLLRLLHPRDILIATAYAPLAVSLEALKRLHPTQCRGVDHSNRVWVSLTAQLCGRP